MEIFVHYPDTPESDRTDHPKELCVRIIKTIIIIQGGRSLGLLPPLYISLFEVAFPCTLEHPYIVLLPVLEAAKRYSQIVRILSLRHAQRLTPLFDLSPLAPIEKSVIFVQQVSNRDAVQGGNLLHDLQGEFAKEPPGSDTTAACPLSL